jgi:hypothetical protein
MLVLGAACYKEANRELHIVKLTGAARDIARTPQGGLWVASSISPSPWTRAP